MNDKMTPIIIITTIFFFMGFTGWMLYEDNKPFEVKVIEVHVENYNQHWFTRVPSYAIYERTDTHQRITGRILGKEGDVFTTSKHNL